MAERDPFEDVLARATSDPITRRELLRRSAFGAALVATPGFVAACGGDDDEEAAPEARRGGRLVVGALEDSYETKGAEANVGQYPLNANVFEGLVRMTPDYEVVPVLAERWEFRAPNTWRFFLRRNVQFHDGQAFNAEAAKFSFDRVAETGGGTPGFGEKNVVVDEFTIDVTPVFENRRLVEQIVHPLYSIVAPGTNPGAKPVGTGPFRFGAYRAQQEISVRRFDRYWGKKANLDELVFRFIPEPNSRRLALEAGEVDLILDVPREAVEDLEAKGFTVAKAPVGAYEAMFANKSGAKGYTILQDANVRRAIALAIDRESLVDGVFEGLAEPSQSFIPARLLGDANAGQVEGFAYNVDEANRLLDEAGWTRSGEGIRSKDGRPLRLQLVNGFPSAERHGAAPEFLQDQLRRVGIEIQIAKAPDPGTYEERLVAGQGDLWLEQGAQNDANPTFLGAVLFWSRSGDFGDPGYRALFAPGTSFDRPLEQALATEDAEEAKALTAQALDVLIDREAIVIPLAGIYGITAMAEKVQGFEPQASGLQVRFDTVSLAGD
jgi:peptide/nickel transport system substrate-binding protein